MKKFKLFFVLFITVFLFTGCGVDYNLKYKNSTFYENIKFTFINNDENQLTKNYFKENDFHVSYSYKYKNNYDKEISENNEKIYVDLSTSYRKIGFADSRVFEECFPTYSVIENENGSIIISTGEGFYCWDYQYAFTDYINITFETDKIVEQHNADKVKGNVYYWEINEENLETFKINLVISNKVDNNSINFFTRDFAENQGVLLLGLLSVVVVALIIVFIVKRINEKQNKI